MEDTEDKRIWVNSSNGDFNGRDTYVISADKGVQDHWDNKWVRKVPTPLRIKFFLWLCAHNSIKVDEILACRGIGISPNCPRCGSESESIVHRLRDYQFSMQGFEFCLGDQSKLTIGIECSSTSLFQCSISGLHTGYIHTHNIHNLYIHNFI